MENYNIELDKEITNFLLAGGLPANAKGFPLLKSAIQLCVTQPDLTYNITKGLYPAVAQLHNTKPTLVERNIRYCITEAFYAGTLFSGENFKNFANKNNHKNGFVIATYSNKITAKMQSNQIAYKKANDSIVQLEKYKRKYGDID